MRAYDVYIHQCSIFLDTAELATLDATLVAGDANLLTHGHVLQADDAPYILAEMTMEGLYGRSSDQAYCAGLPGKSGVGGGILAVIPGVVGIAVSSPPLDEEGNGAHDQRMAALVVKQLGYSMFKG